MCDGGAGVVISHGGWGEVMPDPSRVMLNIAYLGIGRVRLPTSLSFTPPRLIELRTSPPHSERQVAGICMEGDVLTSDRGTGAVTNQT